MPRAAFLCGLVLLAGCVTTRGRFDKATEAEAGGDPYRAARAWARVLERDPDYRDARARFAQNAERAAPWLWGEAQAAHDAGRYPDAVARLDDLAALRDLARRWQVAVEVPAGYDAFYERASEGAVRQLFGDADAAAARGRYPDADAQYEKALAYSMPAALRDELDTRRVALLLDWAAAVADAGEFRRGYALAGRVLTYAPRPAAASLDAARRLQTDALDAGTETVAFLPVQSAPAAEGVPPGWATELSARLGDTYWSAPPPFLDATAARDVRREVGRRGGTSPFTRAEAVGIGRAVGADWVVASEIRAFTRAEQGVRETPVSVKTRDGRDTTYTDHRALLALGAQVHVRLIETTTRNVVAELTIPATATADLHYALFGDPSRLRLSSAQRDLFDPSGRVQAEADAMARLADALAEKLAAAVFEGLLAQIP